MLEERIDERRNGGDADNESTGDKQEADNGDDPPSFAFTRERPELAEKSEEVFRGAHGEKEE